MKKIAITNFKGGIGKTSTAVHLSGAIAELGHRVLVCDCDSQGDLSAVFLTGHESLPYSIADLFADTGLSIASIIQPTDFPNISVVPADRRLNYVDKTHDYATDPAATTLADSVSELNGKFDVVIFDCPPRPHLTSFAALAASDEIIVPCQPSQFSVRSLSTLLTEVQTVQKTLNPRLRIRGYFLSMVSARSKTQETCRRLLVQALGDELVFKTAIPLMATLDTSINMRKPVVFHSKRSKAAEIIRAFSLELLGDENERSQTAAA